MKTRQQFVYANFMERMRGIMVKTM